MRELWSITSGTTTHVQIHPRQKKKLYALGKKKKIYQPTPATYIIEDAPGAHWSVYVDFLHEESGALRKMGSQGAAGGSGSEASFHDLTSTRSLRRDLGSCCWNKGSGGVRLCISVFWGSRRFAPPGRPPPLALAHCSASAQALIIADASSCSSLS